MKKNRAVSFVFLLAFSFCYEHVSAQTGDDGLARIILARDSVFWIAYNQCDVEGMSPLLTDSLEFYHDKGGLILGRENLLLTTRRNLCSNENFRLRREAVDGTVKVFPLQKQDGTVYGAILSGEHVFYVIEKGKPERLDGLAKFTHVWLVRDGVWKMTRVLSFDHGPAPYRNNRKVAVVSDKILNQYVGRYNGSHAGLCIVEKNNNVLQLSVGDQKYTLLPESNKVFFLKERDLTIEFVKNEKGKVSRMIVRENGNIVDEAVVKK